MRVEAEVLVDAAPSRVWEALLAWEDQPRWMVDAESVEPIGPRREGEGVRIAVGTRVAGVPLFSEILEVVGWDPPRRLAMAHRRFVRGIGTWILEPADGRPRLRWREQLALAIPVLGELALLLYRPIMLRLMRRSLANLAEWFEG